MFKDKLNNLFGKKEDGQENKKRKIENLVFFVIILIITIIAINLVWNDNKQKEVKQEESDKTKVLATQNTTDTKINKDSLETKLENILKEIQGVGEVKVFINYSESSEVIAMYNENSQSSTTEETDTEGGVRKIETTDMQKDIIYQEENGVKTPMTQKVIEPKIEGAIITAKGAGNIDVKTNIIQAVEAVTGLATHKIQVFQMEG